MESCMIYAPLAVKLFGHGFDAALYGQQGVLIRDGGDICVGIQP